MNKIRPKYDRDMTEIRPRYDPKNNQDMIEIKPRYDRDPRP